MLPSVFFIILLSFSYNRKFTLDFHWRGEMRRLGGGRREDCMLNPFTLSLYLQRLLQLSLKNSSFVLLCSSFLHASDSDRSSQWMGEIFCLLNFENLFLPVYDSCLYKFERQFPICIWRKIQNMVTNVIFTHWPGLKERPPTARRQGRCWRTQTKRGGPFRSF